MRAPRALQAALLSVSLFALASCRAAEPEGPRAIDFSLSSLDGQRVSLSDFRGKVVIVDFWATWCPPCRELIPQLLALKEAREKDGLVILGIALDREGPQVVSPFVKSAGITYPVLLPDGRVVKDFGGVESIPTLFVVDRKGRVVRKLVGFHSQAQLDFQIDRYLKEG